MAGAMEDRDPRCKVGGHRQRSGHHWAARWGSSHCTSRCAQPGGGAGLAVQLLARYESHPRRGPFLCDWPRGCCDSVVYSSLHPMFTKLSAHQKEKLSEDRDLVCLEFPAVFTPETAVNVDRMREL